MNASKNKILIIEDSMTQATMLLFILNSHDFDVLHTINANNAIEALNKFTPDIIISDIIMPGMDGYMFCNFVKSDEKLKQIPVILLTALSDPRDVIKGLECGADGFIVKPYSEDLLISRIQYFIKNADQRNTASDKTAMEVLFDNENYNIKSSSRQILDLLLSTYENSIQKNQELIDSNKNLKLAQNNLKQLNLSLEKMVKIRTQELENTNQILKEKIEEQSKTEIELNIALGKAEESERLKIAFLSNMSHEIRTPLNAIIGFSDMIDDDYLTQEERRKFKEIITGNGAQLLSIISDIIDVAKIDSQQLTVSKVSFNLNSLLDELLSMYTNEKTIKNKPEIQIILKKSLPGEGSNIISDDIRLRQILINLLSNALKFTKQGYIKFGYEVQGTNLHFYVQDSGKGIAKEKQSLIFERFRQEEETTTRQYGGTGLGLTISKGLVILLEGNIWLDSDNGTGSTFYFSIPYQFSSAAQTVEDNYTLAGADL
jgi:two-component system sensor histidine kinase/response regulator